MSSVCYAEITWSGDVGPANPSTWDSSTTGYIGIFGSGTMDISSGSDVTDKDGYIGYYSGSTGAVTVDGSGSTWTNNANLVVGYRGNGTLNITDGGTVSNNGYGYIGENNGSTGTVSVDGPGSTWTNNGNLKVGDWGNGTLNITNGGAVSNDDGYVGTVRTGEVTVDGANSTWTNSGDLYIGYHGNGMLNITDGGAVTVDREIWVSHLSSSSGVINFNNGTLTTSGLGCNFDDLTGTGTINTNGQVSDGDLIFDSVDDLSQTFTLNKPGQNITVNLDVDGSGSMGAGYSGTGTMSISNGITVESYNGYIGHISGSTGEVTVDGSGSTWTINGDRLWVGRYGNGTLNITDGGMVSNNSWGIIGGLSGSTGEVNVDGTNSTWTNSGSLTVGHEGNGTLNITGGGTVSNSWSGIGTRFGGTGIVTVDGSGSTWTNSNELGVGGEGDGTLNITGGGAVSNSLGYIGYDSGSTGAVTVDGVGSTWTNNDSLEVGREFKSNGTLNIIGGSEVSSRSGTIGSLSGSTGEVTVNGSGSTWINSDDLRIGDSGNGTLNIIGGAVSNTKGYIGAGTSGTGIVTVDGSGSTWTNSGDLDVGSYGNGTLNITGGGTVSNDNRGLIAYDSGSTSVVTVDSAGSTWTNSDNLYVGAYGNGTLNITDGGLVSVAGILTINYDGDGDDSFINMATGGMLALFGDADDSLLEFLGIIDGTGAIRYWDGSGWADIAGASLGLDYTLEYLTEGDLAGYTMLTVPEPATMLLFGLGGILLRKRS